MVMLREVGQAELIRFLVLGDGDFTLQLFPLAASPVVVTLRLVRF